MTTDWAAFQREMGYSDEELAMFRANKKAMRLLERVDKMAAWDIVAEATLGYLELDVADEGWVMEDLVGPVEVVEHHLAHGCLIQIENRDAKQIVDVPTSAAIVQRSQLGHYSYLGGFVKSHEAQPELWLLPARNRVSIAGFWLPGGPPRHPFSYVKWPILDGPLLFLPMVAISQPQQAFACTSARGYSRTGIARMGRHPSMREVMRPSGAG